MKRSDCLFSRPKKNQPKWRYFWKIVIYDSGGLNAFHQKLRSGFG
ncbi:hypothetical protein [Moorena sp. SIO4G3]|nr:hypothetical protein [Moorena sp. SIO4G3]